MILTKKVLFIFIVSFSIFANDIDAEIIDNLDFYMDMELLEGEEDRVELFQDQEYEKKLNSQIKQEQEERYE